jgi:hypothetical protein
MERLLTALSDGPAVSDAAVGSPRIPVRSTDGPSVNAADPLNRRGRERPDHNRVRDVPSPVSLLGLAPPPPGR